MLKILHQNPSCMPRPSVAGQSKFNLKYETESKNHQILQEPNQHPKAQIQYFYEIFKGLHTQFYESRDTRFYRNDHFTTLTHSSMHSNLADKDAK